MEQEGRATTANTVGRLRIGTVAGEKLFKWIGKELLAIEVTLPGRAQKGYFYTHNVFCNPR